jgi:deoxyribose-phosphate aldolase
LLRDDLVQLIVGLVDLTSLNTTDTEADMAALCERATSPYGHVAAVCVYPAFVRLVADNFAGTEIKTATVVNFPSGDEPLESVLVAINDALEDGANEIDVVFPYKRYLAGDKEYAQSFVSTCKTACGDKALLKVILETGVLKDPDVIAAASKDALTAGADFIKTSTGKVAEGATLEAAGVMLKVIKQMSSPRTLGVKVSGGIRTVEQAVEYVQLAESIMGKDWVSPKTFRIGASKIV